jgi:hypothetical protein
MPLPITYPGTRSREALMGDRPRAPCRYMMTRNRTAKLASPWKRAARSDGAIAGRRNSDRLTMGSGCALSILAKTAIMTMPPP